MRKEAVPNNFLTGFTAGLILPVIVFIMVYIASSREMTFASYLGRIIDRNLVTHFMSLCVFPNVFVFLIFNRFNKLKSSRGVLGVTIIWALAVFLIKLL